MSSSQLLVAAASSSNSNNNNNNNAAFTSSTTTATTTTASSASSGQQRMMGGGGGGGLPHFRLGALGGSLLDFPSGVSPSPLPTIEQTPNRLLAAGGAGAAGSKLEMEPNIFEQSFSSSTDPINGNSSASTHSNTASTASSNFNSNSTLSSTSFQFGGLDGFLSSPKPVLPPLTARGSLFGSGTGFTPNPFLFDRMSDFTPFSKLPLISPRTFERHLASAADIYSAPPPPLQPPPLPYSRQNQQQHQQQQQQNSLESMENNDQQHQHSHQDDISSKTPASESPSNLSPRDEDAPPLSLDPSTLVGNSIQNAAAIFVPTSDHLSTSTAQNSSFSNDHQHQKSLDSQQLHPFYRAAASHHPNASALTSLVSAAAAAAASNPLQEGPRAPLPSILAAKRFSKTALAPLPTHFNVPAPIDEPSDNIEPTSALAHHPHHQQHHQQQPQHHHQPQYQPIATHPHHDLRHTYYSNPPQPTPLMIDASQAIRHQDHLTIPVPRSTTSTDSYDDVSIVSVVPGPALLRNPTSVPQNHQQPPPLSTTPPSSFIDPSQPPQDPSRDSPIFMQHQSLASHLITRFPTPAPPKKRTADTAFPNPPTPTPPPTRRKAVPKPPKQPRRVKIEPSPPPPSTTSSTSSRRATSDIPEDGPKRKVFLERNRQAALKCRQKKKQWLSELQGKVENMEEENETLREMTSRLREEVLGLKAMLLGHRDCDVAVENGLDVAAIEATLSTTLRPFSR